MNKYILCILLSLLVSNTLHAQEIGEGENEIPVVTPESTPAETATPTATETPAEAAPATPAVTAKPRPQRMRPNFVSSWAAGLTSLQWNENMTVTYAGKVAKFPSNFNGIGLVLQKETYYLRWGWNFGGVFSVGKASGGGDDGFGVTYTQGRQSYVLYGITPRIFWRLSNRVNIGASAFIYSRTIDWPEPSGTSVDSGRRLNVTGLADLNIRMFNKWDFYQGIGPVAPESTMWKIGVNYRF